MKPENLDKIIRLRHELHRHPDLSLHEEGTMAILRAFLEENTSLEIAEREGWFYAVRYGDPDRAPIAFRADMDALPIDESGDAEFSRVSENPGVSHKCGHDGHMAALCGLALELDAADTGTAKMNEKHPRTVYMIFQPAEEIGRGAEHCAGLIREKGISEIYAFHNLGGYPEGALVFRRGLTQPASEGLTIRFHGKTCHAGAPEEGINPAEALARTALRAQELNAADSCAEPDRWCTITGMKCGDADFGISPGEASLAVTLRAAGEAVMKEMEEDLVRYAGRLAEESGLRTDREISDYFPETRNHDEALERVLRAARELKILMIGMKEMWRASEDFGHYLKECPGAIFYIGNGKDWPALHTAQYDFNDRILGTAVDLFSRLALGE